MMSRIFLLAACPVLAGAVPSSIPVDGAVSFEVSENATLARGRRGGFWSNGSEMRFGAGADAVVVKLEGARTGLRAQPLQPQPRTTHYFLGRESGGTRVLPHFGRVRFAGVYPGVDFVIYGAGQDVEYDFELDPNTSPRAIVLAFDRAVGMRADGALVLTGESGDIVQQPPRAFQGGEEIRVRYRRLGDRRIGFELGRYDHRKPLTIDPRISLAGFFGGIGADRIQDAAFDSKGDLWIAGQTNSPDFPLPPSGFPSTRRGASDVFVAKLQRRTDPSGVESWVLATTLFLGGAGRDRAAGVGVDSAGRVYVFGDTQSTDFPISNNAEQRGFAGGTDSFVTVLRETDFPFFTLGKESAEPAQGAFTNYEIEYSSLHGGAGEDVAVRGRLSSFAEDRNLPCAILAGQTTSANLRTSIFAVQEDHGGGTDAYFAVFCRQAGAGYPLIYGTFLGGNREEAGAAMAVAASGSFCIGTRTFSASLPSNGMQRTWGGASDVYLGCFAPVRRRFGLPFLYREIGRTFWGGSGTESLADIELQNTGEGPEAFRAFVLAESNSENLAPLAGLPVPEGGALANPGSRSMLVGAFPPGLGRSLSQFWLGGRSQETAADMTFSAGCLAVAGQTTSADLPASPTFPVRPLASGEDLAAGKFCFNDQMTQASTVYLGAYGSLSDDAAASLTAGPFDDEVLTGWTTSGGGTPPPLPPSPGAPQQGYAGGVEDGLLLGFHRPRLRPEAIVGAADFLARPVAPGQLLSIFGLGIGPGTNVGPQLDEAGRLRRDLGGVRVLFDGVAAPMIFASRNQVSAVAPFFLDVRQSVAVQLETGGAASEPVTLPVAPTAPAVFTLSQTGSGQAAVLNEDSSVNGENRPAAPGSLLQIFLTGVGQTLPRGVDGELIPARQPFPQINAPVVVRIGGQQTTVIYAGGAPGQVHGVAQINAVTPRGLIANPRTSLEITIGGAAIQPGVTVAIAGAP